ncbi:MAG: ribosome silencing factor [Desulfobacterales bacterium]
MTQKTEPALDLFLNIIQERKALDIVVLDVSGLSSVADTFIICSGRSTRQVSAIADHIQSEMRKIGVKPLGIEGKTAGHWILMDYGHIVIHIFFTETREFFNLEGLWSDAERIDIPAPAQKPAPHENDTTAFVFNDDD